MALPVSQETTSFPRSLDRLARAVCTADISAPPVQDMSLVPWASEALSYDQPFKISRSIVDCLSVSSCVICHGSMLTLYIRGSCTLVIEKTELFRVGSFFGVDYLRIRSSHSLLLAHLGQMSSLSTQKDQRHPGSTVLPADQWKSYMRGKRSWLLTGHFLLL